MSSSSGGGGNMSGNMKKRRLALMPEILPTPERIEGRADPRTRILERMRQLAATNANANANANEGEETGT